MNIYMTDEMRIILESAKLKNMNVWDYLLKICVLLGSPLISQLEVELQEYIKKSSGDGLELQDRVSSMAQRDDRQIKRALVSEANTNARLKQFLRMCRGHIKEMQVQGQPVPSCPTSWIYQDFPILSELNKVQIQPLTVLLDHILDRYDLDKDEHFKKTILRIQVSSMWHKNFKFARKAHVQKVSESNSINSAVTSEPNQACIEGDISRTSDNAGGSNADIRNEAKSGILNSFTVSDKEYARVVSGSVDDLILRLVRKHGSGGRDVTSEAVIAEILRESLGSQTPLQGAGYLVHRYKKIAKRRLKANVEKEMEQDPPKPFSSDDSGKLSISCHKDTRPCPQNEPEVRAASETKRSSFLTSVAKFQNRFRSASFGHGQKRKAPDSSTCRGFQAKFSKTRMDTALAALKRHVAKRLMASSHH